MARKKTSNKGPHPYQKDPNHIYNKLIKDFPTIHAGWKKVNIEVCENLNLGGDEVDGLTYFHDGSIKLEASLTDTIARETILHEIFHWILEGIGLDERNFNNSLISTTNEALVTSISKHMIIISMLNPGLFPLIFGTTEL